MSEEHVCRLSTIDQSLLRSYIRYALCFPCKAVDFDVTTRQLALACQRVVTHLPMLAGTVQPVPTADGDGYGEEQKGRLEVVVTLDSIQNFHPTGRHLSIEEFPFAYESLAKRGMPSRPFLDERLTPLPDPKNAPAFAVQANFISGGVFVALYLHHSVADVHGMGQIMRIMSSELPTRKLQEADLRADAAEQSKVRDRLSRPRAAKPGSRARMQDEKEAERVMKSELASEKDSTAGGSKLTGEEKGTCRVLAFNLATIEETKDMINERFHYIHEDRFITVSALDCLTAILWKAVSRATWADGPPDEEMSRLHRLTLPVSLRKRVHDYPLPDDYFGNAVTHAEARSSILQLGKPYELGSLSHTARLIRTSVGSITEEKIRDRIHLLNNLKDISTAAISNKCFDVNLVVPSWADLPLAEAADLGLGLGQPQFGRKVGRGHSGYGCIVLPVSRDKGMWEVMITLTQEVMENMLADEGLRAFVKEVA